MKTLPDPRIYAPNAVNALALMADAAARRGSALQQTAPGRALVDAVDSLLAGNQLAALQGALAGAGSAAARSALERAIELASRAPSDRVGLHAFAFPILFIAGGKASARIAGIVPDIAALREVLEAHGAFGQARNVGIGNALASPGSLEAISPVTLYQLGRDASIDGPAAIESLQLPPADIVLDSADEQVHLRFLPGVAIASGNAPGVAETAANIGAWGMAWTRALARQLAQPGLALLPVPRPPLPIRRALAAGRFACREMKFQLFLSRALRTFRSSVGEPDVAVASSADGSVQVRLSSPLDEALSMQYKWLLEPDDEFAAVGGTILGLLAECRVDRVDVADTVQPVSASH